MRTDGKKPKPLRTKREKFTKVGGEKRSLSERTTFAKAWKHWGGKMFLNGDPINLAGCRPYNFLHVLDKKNYPMFKYYYKNVVLGTLGQHEVYDQGTEEKLSERIRGGLESISDWQRLLDYREELKLEYKNWIKYHKNEYKL
jgi:hypothetical protein